MVVLVVLFFVLLFVKNDEKTSLDDSALTLFIDECLTKEEYNSIVVYTLNNINYLTKIFDILNYRLNSLNNTVYGYIDRINILRIMITLNNSINHNYYMLLEKNVIELSNKNYISIDEYVSVVDLFNELLSYEEFDLEFLEILAQKNVQIVDKFIDKYFPNTKNLNSFAYDRYFGAYRNYLNVILKTYRYEKNGVTLEDKKLKYKLVKSKMDIYEKSDAKAFLIPFIKASGKTVLYYKLSSFFDRKISTGIKAVGAVDVGSDAISLYKNINYNLYGDEIHEENRESYLYMNKFNKIYYFLSNLYHKIFSNNDNLFTKYEITCDNKDNIDKIKRNELNRAIRRIDIIGKDNINNTLEKYEDDSFLSFIDDIILKNKKEKNLILKNSLKKKHSFFMEKINIYKNFLQSTCI